MKPSGVHGTELVQAEIASRPQVDWHLNSVYYALELHAGQQEEQRVEHVSLEALAA